jgi:hypothetical protein
MFEALFALEEGDLEASRTLAEEAVRALRDLGARRELVGALIVMGRVMAAQTDYRKAGLLIGAAEGIYGRSPAELPLLKYEEIASSLKCKLAEDFETIVNQGRVIGWDGLLQLIEKEVTDTARAE